MSFAEEPYAERRRRILLALPMVAGNALLFLCMVGLGIAALSGGKSLGIIPRGGDPSQRIVRDYLAERVPGSRYRIREWFPATPLEENLAAAPGNRSGLAAEKGLAQRVKLVFYGPSGARQLDTVYWIQNGKVTRKTQVDPSHLARAP